MKFLQFIITFAYIGAIKNVNIESIILFIYTYEYIKNTKYIWVWYLERICKTSGKKKLEERSTIN